MTLLYSCSAAVTLLLAYSQWIRHATPEGKTAIAFLAAYVGILFAVLIWREFVYSRKARYAEVLNSMNDSFMKLQELAVDGNASAAQIKETSAKVLTNLATAFSTITSTTCSACIKLLEGDPAAGQSEDVRVKVRTLCRSNNAEKRRARADSKKFKHWLDQNTDFFELHRRAGTPQEDCFFSNNLPRYPGYMNTSFEVYGGEGHKPPPPSLLLSWLGLRPWVLPYKSAIVVPIFPRTANETDGRLVGYLCIDSKSRGAFSRRYDPELLTGIGDCLYEVVRRYCNLVAQPAGSQSDGI